MFKEFEYGGFVYSNCTAEQLIAYGIPAAHIAAAESAVKWELIRSTRDGALSACDYAVMPDYPLEDGQLNEVKIYRQALRDIPDQGPDPESVVWPKKPSYLK